VTRKLAIKNQSAVVIALGMGSGVPGREYGLVKK
jgi:hypothetical protein